MEFLSLTGGCIGSSESIYVKMPHCWKHIAAQLFCPGSQSYSLSVSGDLSLEKLHALPVTYCFTMALKVIVSLYFR